VELRHSTVQTVIHARGGGRFGNQLLRFAHWLAWVLDAPSARRVVDVAFWPYARLFATWRLHPGCVYPWGERWLDGLAALRSVLPDRVLRHADPRVSALLVGGGHLWPTTGVVELDDASGESCDLDVDGFGSGHAHVVCSGWRFEAWGALERHQARVRQLLLPATAPWLSASRHVEALRRRHDVLVGLFVRRGDYAQWASGRHYHGWHEYVAWTRQICALFPGRRVGVLLAGDERFPLERWADLPVELASGTLNRGGHWFQSFLELSACDHIVAPPSTFAACASFLGGSPLWPLRSAGQVLSESQPISGGLIAAHRDPDFSKAVH